VEKARECKSREESVEQKIVKRRNRPTAEEMKEAKEKITNLESQLTAQKTMMEEHQGKMAMLEQLIKQQCLILKENDDKCSYEQLAKTAPGKEVFSSFICFSFADQNSCYFNHPFQFAVLFSLCSCLQSISWG
jgi:hypothetical protein